MRSSDGRIRLYRRLVFGIVLFCVSLPALLLADDWPGPQTREVFSQNRQYFVRITPGESWGETWGFAGAKIGRHAQAAFFREQSDKGYRLERTIFLTIKDTNELSRWRDNVDMWETVVTHMDRMQKNMESMGPGMMHGRGMGGPPPTPPTEKKPE